MKSFGDLETALSNQEYYNAQFEESGLVKNILFVSPQLTGKHVYKFILPYFCMLGAVVETAITSVEKFDYNADPKESFKKVNSVLFPQQVIWADYVVFPFILSRLGGAEDDSFYKKLKEMNPDVKIVYHVDFNYYQLSKLHPYYTLFNKQTISIVEDNIYFADICITSNMEFHTLLHKVVNKLSETKYQGNPPNLKIGNIPILFDLETLLMNVDYNPEQPLVIDNRKAKKTVEVAKAEKKKTVAKKNDLTAAAYKKAVLKEIQRMYKISATKSKLIMDVAILKDAYGKNNKPKIMQPCQMRIKQNSIKNLKNKSNGTKRRRIRTKRRKRRTATV